MRSEKNLRSKGISEFRYDMFVEARYLGKKWEMEIRVPPGWYVSADDTVALRRAFVETHQRLYSVAQPETHIEANNWRLRLTAILERPMTTWIARQNRVSRVERYTEAYFDVFGNVRTEVHDGTTLDSGIASYWSRNRRRTDHYSWYRARSRRVSLKGRELYL